MTIAEPLVTGFGVDAATARRMADGPCTYWDDGAHCFSPMRINSVRGQKIVKACACGAFIGTRQPRPGEQPP